MQIPRQLNTLAELPQENPKFPSFVLDNRRVLMIIGRHSSIWSFSPQSEPLHLSRHGTFEVEGCHAQGAVIRMTIPRKGWNTTRGETVIDLPLQTEITVRRGELFVHSYEGKDWESALTRYKILWDWDRRQVINVEA